MRQGGAHRYVANIMVMHGENIFNYSKVFQSVKACESWLHARYGKVEKVSPGEYYATTVEGSIVSVMLDKLY